MPKQTGCARRIRERDERTGLDRGCGPLEPQPGGWRQLQARDYDREVLDPSAHVPKRRGADGVGERHSHGLAEGHEVVVIPAAVVRASEERVAPRRGRGGPAVCVGSVGPGQLGRPVATRAVITLCYAISWSRMKRQCQHEWSDFGRLRVTAPHPARV